MKNRVRYFKFSVINTFLVIACALLHYFTFEYRGMYVPDEIGYGIILVSCASVFVSIMCYSLYMQERSEYEDEAKKIEQQTELVGKRLVFEYFAFELYSYCKHKIENELLPILSANSQYFDNQLVPVAPYAWVSFPLFRLLGGRFSKQEYLLVYDFFLKNVLWASEGFKENDLREYFSDIYSSSDDIFSNFSQNSIESYARDFIKNISKDNSYIYDVALTLDVSLFLFNAFSDSVAALDNMMDNLGIK